MRAAKIKDSEVIDAIKNSSSMNEAANRLQIPFMSLKSRAQRLGIYNPCPIGWQKGRSPFNKVDLTEVLEGQHPDYNTTHLRERLIKEKIFEYKCANCGIDTWRGKSIALQLHHKDGYRRNHKKANLEFLCPNCHSQTDNHNGKSCHKY